MKIYSIVNAPYELINSGHRCTGQNNGWKGSRSTLEQCRERVLADAECAPDYFEFTSSDQNCRCAALASEGTDCSQASNWAGDGIMLIYRINPS
jgi:hypothetical protein